MSIGWPPGDEQQIRGGPTTSAGSDRTIGQHFGRPYTPTDQAWIETLWGHVKAENPHLLTITEPWSTQRSLIASSSAA